MSRATALLLVILAVPAVAQTHRHMVFFSDKTGTPHTISAPSTFLSSRAVERREKVGASISAEDLPVVPSYVTQVRATGAKAFFTTRWLNGVLVEATSAQLTAIEALPFVSSTEYVAPNQQLIGGRRGAKWILMAAQQATDVQLSMHGLDRMHLDGYEGEGIMIAVLDTGFPGVESADAFERLRNENRIRMTEDFIRNSGDVYQYDDHGTNVLSVMAAEEPGFKGGAVAADYLLFVTEDAASEYRIEEYNWLFAAEQADSAGADIIQSSVVYTTFDDSSMDYTTSDLDGATTVISLAAGRAVARGIVVVASAGNLGSTPWQFIGPPADVVGVLSVGAVSVSGSRAGFSSIGPNSNGGIKPDVAALGVGVSVINSAGNATTASGTSVAAPLVSSLVAGLLQAYPNLNPMTLLDDIRESSTQGLSPDNEIGYGIPSYLAVKNFYEINQHYFSVFPNPVAQVLYVSLPMTENPVDLVVLDMQGKVVHHATAASITWSNRAGYLDVSGLAAGLYILHLTFDKGSATFRFVKL